MAARIVTLALNVYLLAYGFDAALSTLEEILRKGLGIDALVGARNSLALLVVLASLAVLPGAVLSPRLRPALSVPLAVSAVWMAAGALPVPLWLGPAVAEPALTLFQLALAAWTFQRVRASSPERRVLVVAEDDPRPVFSLRHTLVGVPLLGAGVMAGVIAYVPLWIVTAIHSGTDGFVHFGLSGVSLVERRFAQGGKEIGLVGMMHVGDEAAYATLARSFSTPGTLVLEEGVTDEHDRLGANLSFENAARSMGLTPQAPLETYLETDAEGDAEPWPHLRPADVDASAFRPETVAWIETTSEIWQSDGLVEALRRALASTANDPELLNIVWNDILTNRNRHLIAELDRALLEYDRVVVPWGALHQPEIQQHVRDLGFAQTRELHHPIASWLGIARALFDDAGG